jgi:hypothetical protein
MSEIRNQRLAALAEQQMKESARIARINSAKDLAVYKAAYELAMKIFELSKRFPTEEKFALTSQIRRSSRSVCLNLREAWAKRRYEADFVNKLTDSGWREQRDRLITRFRQGLRIHLHSRASSVDEQMRRDWTNAQRNDEKIQFVPEA